MAAISGYDIRWWVASLNIIDDRIGSGDKLVHQTVLNAYADIVTVIVITKSASVTGSTIGKGRRWRCLLIQ